MRLTLQSLVGDLQNWYADEGGRTRFPGSRRCRHFLALTQLMRKTASPFQQRSRLPWLRSSCASEPAAARVLRGDDGGSAVQLAAAGRKPCCLSHVQLPTTPTHRPDRRPSHRFRQRSSNHLCACGCTLVVPAGAETVHLLWERVDEGGRRARLGLSARSPPLARLNEPPPP